MKRILRFIIIILFTAPSGVGVCLAQGDARVTARIDSRQITVGDQARLFIEAQNNPATTKLQWAVIPDTFNNLEVVERGRIDTFRQGDVMTYRQRLLITGFDSGAFRIPSFVFPVIPNTGSAYTLQTDSFELIVQTVPVDTTKAFKPIKNIIYVKSSWLDYIGYILGGVALLAGIVALIVFLVLRSKRKPKRAGPAESLTDYTMRVLSELDNKQLWQKNQVKQYYTDLTDIVRTYIEKRFATPAMELTTDELLHKAQMLPEMQPYHDTLSFILHTADLAKFAKAQPLPQEHVDAMEKAKQFVVTSKPVIIETPAEQQQQTTAQQPNNDAPKAE